MSSAVFLQTVSSVSFVLLAVLFFLLASSFSVLLSAVYFPAAPPSSVFFALLEVSLFLLVSSFSLLLLAVSFPPTSDSSVSCALLAVFFARLFHSSCLHFAFSLLVVFFFVLVVFSSFLPAVSFVVVFLVSATTATSVLWLLPVLPFHLWTAAVKSLSPIQELDVTPHPLPVLKKVTPIRSNQVGPLVFARRRL